MTYNEIVQDSFENFPLSSAVVAASEALANESQSDSLGAIFTKKEVVDFILDLMGYTADQELYVCRILEPSFGGGDFLFPIVRRLLESTKRLGLSKSDITLTIVNSIFAVELQRTTFDKTSSLLKTFLTNEGFSPAESDLLSNSWLKRCDFLLAGNIGRFDYVAGNPPYVRQELIPEALIKEYRSRYSTIYDRADLYIPFIERSLLSLKPYGKLGFICADRWMKNRYGGPLRKLVAEKFSLKYYVDMSKTSAFHSDVVAYPAITIFERSHVQKTKIAYHPIVDAEFLRGLALELISDQKPSHDIREVLGVVVKSEPWLLESYDQMDIIRRIEKNYPAIEEVGCKVGIGVATGADKIFISDFEKLDVEADRKLRLVTTKDLKGGEVNWTGQAVINPFLDSGGVVDLTDFPKLNAYLQEHRATIEARHVSKKNPSQWFRTIDRITPSLAFRPKLLIPDIKGDAHVVFEGGELYPHHNLYYVVSDHWDLRALQGVLLSSITKLFVANYSTKMRGGYLRFQAQYLRRIRLPKWESVNQSLRDSLAQGAIKLDLDACNRAAFELYELSASERAALGGDEVDGS